jgi:pimeloyl-ACP methyl ester carboxylesterase
MSLHSIDIQSSAGTPMRIAYRHWNTGKNTLKLLCHGLGGHSQSVSIQPVIEQAIRAGHDVLSMDWPFHGCSSLPFQQNPTLTDMMITLCHIVELASAKYGTVDIISHSMGSIFAICWGTRHGPLQSRVRSIVAMNPGFPKVNWVESCIVRLMGKSPIQYGHAMLTHSHEWTDNVSVVEARLQDSFELKYIQDAAIIPLLDGAKELLAHENCQRIPVHLIWSENDPVIDTSAVAQLLENDNYHCLLKTDVPYHELCTTNCVGKQVCDAALWLDLRNDEMDVDEAEADLMEVDEANDQGTMLSYSFGMLRSLLT